LQRFSLLHRSEKPFYVLLAIVLFCWAGLKGID
jgi:hypothetical protein